MKILILSFLILNSAICFCQVDTLSNQQQKDKDFRKGVKSQLGDNSKVKDESDDAFANGVKSQLGENYKTRKNNGYGFLTAGAFLAKNNTFFYPSLGMGVRNNNAAIGIVFYYNKDLSVSVHGDLRMFLSKSRTGVPFISIQPGKCFYTKTLGYGNTKIKSEGGFAFNAMAGFMVNGKNGTPGPYLSVGYGMINFNSTVSSHVTQSKTEGVIISGGIKF